MVLNLKHMPVLFKELCTDYNFVRSHRKMKDDPILINSGIGVHDWPEDVLDNYLKHYKKTYFKILGSF